MSVLKVMLIILLVGVIIGVGVFAYWVEKMRKPGGKVDCQTHSNWLWDKSCLFFQEKFYDSSLKSPENIEPVLTSFRFAQGAGSPFFLPCWYRIRYINVKTGGYSKFSKWTRLPVISGACKLPCPNDGCGSNTKTGYESCDANQPTIGISKNQSQYNPYTQQKDGSYIYINLHRYTGKSFTDSDPPPDDAEDEIIGYLTLGTVDGVSYYDWTDALFNPCKEGCNIPTWCQNENKC